MYFVEQLTWTDTNVGPKDNSAAILSLEKQIEDGAGDII